MSTVITRDASVLTIRLDRPEKKNALTVAMYQAMTEAIASAEGDDAIRAIVLVGSATVFTAGNDLGDFMRAASGGGGDALAPLRFLEALATAPKPVIAGVDGLAIGIGTTLLLHCDLAYASPGARFRTPFVELGLTPEAGSSLLLPQLMGHRRAAALLLAGEELDAEGALAAGLVNAVVPDATAAALDAARRMATRAPGALFESKRLMKRAQSAPIAEAMRLEAEVFTARLRSPEAMAAFMAFSQKQRT
jgi:enoyl-CoA hydratase/carnithine racemase